MNKRTTGAIILSIFSAALCTLSFPNFNLWFVIWFALVPLLFAIDGKGRFVSFLLSYLFGFFFAGTLCYWLGYLSIRLLFFILIYESFYFGFFGLIANRVLAKKLPLFLEIIIISLTWTALEFMRTHLLIGLGWGVLAYSQADHPLLIQTADIMGCYGLTFLIITVNVLIKQGISQYLLFTKRMAINKAGFGLSVIVVATLLISNLIYGINRLNKEMPSVKKIKVSVIQGNIPQDQKWKPQYRPMILKKYENLTTLASKDSPDLIVWPETAVPGYLKGELNLERFLSGLSKQVGTYVLAGTPRQSGLVRDYYNSAVLFNPQGEMVTFYDKQRLVPLAEFGRDPELQSKAKKFFGIPEESGFGDCVAGREPVIFNLPKAKFGVLICFEELFTAGEFIQKGANFLINIANDAIFGESAQPFQHSQAAIFRAVEYRLPVVRCSNTGVSEFIDAYGRVYSRLTDASGKAIMVAGHKTEWVNIKLSPTHVFSFYTTREFWFANLCLKLLIIIIIALPFIKRVPKT